jgi:cytochrome c oxidase assembly protein subunit 11
MTASKPGGRKRTNNAVTAAFVVGAVVAMAAAAYAAVPLYYAFCRATGYNGTPRRVAAAPNVFGDRIMTVHFDTNVMSDLPWTFAPETPFVRVRTGETETVYFKVTNHASHAVTGQAGYNVSPDQSAFYFNKIACFCFSTQTLGPNETAEMPVVFYLDPALEKDSTMIGTNSVTLSYTFYPAKAPKETPRPVASADTQKQL